MSIKQAKVNYIISAATELFLQQGIANVTIKDVTSKVGVGEATIYRYFSTKQNLVISVAGLMANEIRTKYFDLSKEQTGIGKIEAFYNNFLKIFVEHPEYYRFIFEFDATVQMQETNKYEENLLPYMQDFLAAYKLGLQDGTVKEIENVELFYLTTTHAIMGLCKKLTMNSVVLNQDKNGKEEVKILIETIIYRLKNNR